MDPKINTILRFIKEKKFKDAEEKCIEILHKYHNNPEFLNIFAIILFQLKKYDDAISKWKKSILLSWNHEKFMFLVPRPPKSNTLGPRTKI